jgi:NAD(P)-dependent dehydrogenase (short-subunit alcohol dehydrogenase family)
MSVRWTAAQIPDQDGRIVVVTGANTGVGFETARMLAERGASVVLACRNPDKASAAADRLRERTRAATLRVLHLDLASLASIHEAAAELRSAFSEIDLLVCNAGLGWAPFTRTEDGFELTLGTNHLGHFAFTGLVLDRLLPMPGSRIVVVTSPAHREGSIDFDDLQSERRYSRRRAYAQSKLANLLFAHELQSRLDRAGARTIALTAHPGMSRTEFNRNLPLPFRGRSYGVMRPMSQSAETGALPILRAAVDPAVHGGEYFAPDGWNEFKGTPERLEPSAASHDPQTQRQLWETSEALTGVRYKIEDSVRR